jgi:hypothetical protein
MTTDIFCFYLQNSLIQTSQQEVNGTVIRPPLVFPGSILLTFCEVYTGKIYCNNQSEYIDNLTIGELHKSATGFSHKVVLCFATFI